MNSIEVKMAALLQEKIGLDPNVIGIREISRVLERHRVACNCSSLETYFHYLQTNKAEFEALIESVVVPETWFFRDGEPFNFLVRYINTEKLFHQTDKIKILSVPCASGEEPYSIAITLLEAGFKPHQFQIDAVDISQKSLQKAQRGVYTRHSFRGNYLEFRERYFLPITTTEYQLIDSVKNCVNFSMENLINFGFLSNKNPYHIIFCRNVLIYFDSPLQAKVLQIFHFGLAKAGYLFLGRSESVSQAEQLFSPVDLRERLFHKTGESLQPHPITPLVIAKTPAQRRDRKIDLLLAGLIEHFDLTAVLCDLAGNIQHTAGAVDRYLQFPVG
ncbi:MAG TPA: hypothetical protein DCQ63_05235, partial [Planktothrix sp. UBA8402]|nr:hypothetical protein [Planktothrix sp. UBA8402]